MKKIIIVKHTIEYEHRFIIEADSEEDLDEALDNAEGIEHFDDYVDKLNEFVTVLESVENYEEESCGIEFDEDYDYDELEG